MKIEELHDHLYDVLCTIDDICKKNNVRYFLDSGTEIGAVRELNFIPWDDDMDLKVLMKDYPKFKAVLEKELPPYMHLIEPDAFSPYFYDFTIRIYDERYCLHEDKKLTDGRINYENYVGTDVFLFCKAPNGKLSQTIFTIALKTFYGMGMSHRYSLDYSKYSFMQKMQIRILSLMGKNKSVSEIWQAYFKFCSKWENKDTRYYYPVNYPIEYIDGVYSRFFDKKIYSGDADGIIRNRKFPIPSGYDEELKQQYGEYMRPPKNKEAYRRHL